MHAKKEDFAFVIHSSEKNRAVNKDVTTRRRLGPANMNKMAL